MTWAPLAESRHPSRGQMAASRPAERIDASYRARLTGWAVLVVPVLVLAGIGVVVAAVDGQREITGRASWTGILGESDHVVLGPPVTTTMSTGAAAHDGGVDAEVGQLRAEVQALRDALADLERRQTRLESELRVAVATPAAASGRQPEGVSTGRAIAAALLLREAAQTAKPFAAELAAFAALAADLSNNDAGLDRAAVAEFIAQLQPHAGTGMATRRDLRRSFATVVEAVDQARPLSWWESGLVLIGWRADPRAPVDYAATALLYDDLAGAAESLATLAGEPAAAAQGWLKLARARVAIDDAIAGLYRSALAAAPPTGPGDALASVHAAAASAELE